MDVVVASTRPRWCIVSGKRTENGIGKRYPGKGETYMFERFEILDAIKTDGLDSHQLSVDQPLASVGYPCYGRGSTARFSEATV